MGHQVVRAGREVVLGGPRPRAVLALLVLRAGQLFPPGSWRRRPGRDGRRPGPLCQDPAVLRVPVEGSAGPEAALTARGGGYVLALGSAVVDVSRFEELVSAGQTALSQSGPAIAGSRFREALGVWRGQALADVRQAEPLTREATRLEELRLVAVEGRIEADLGAGLHGEVTGELEGLVGEYPLRERLWFLLVLALYRAQRQTDALAAYRRARDLLSSELGLEPGQELRRWRKRCYGRRSLPHRLPRGITCPRR